MQTLTIAMGKGGTGKTSLAVHLADGLAKKGKRVLLVDFDPTAHATAWLMGLDKVGAPGTAEALREERLRPEHLQELPGRPGLSLMPASRTLQTVENELREDGGHAILRNLLREAPGFDFAIIDTPPALGAFTSSALFAADAVLAPIPAAFLSLAGLRLLEESIAKLKRRVRLNAELLGIVLFGADPREAITEQVRDVLRRDAGELLFKSEVRVSTAAKALPARQLTAMDPGADERGAEDYGAVIKETLKRLDALDREHRRGRA